MIRWLSKRLGHGLRYLLMIVLGTGLSIGLSYGTVRYLSKEMRQSSRPDAAQVRTVRHLRFCANELARLAGDYLERLPLDTKTPKPPVRQWIEQGFRPHLDELQRRIKEAPDLNQIPSFQALTAAADRAVIMANHPEDQELRRRTLQDIQTSTQDVQTYLAGLRGVPAGIEPPVAFHLPK
jgi:hypothetical protein